MKKKLTARVDDLIEQGQAKKLIRISDDGKRIEYLRHGISRDWTKPEASVEAKADNARLLSVNSHRSIVPFRAPLH